MLPRPLPLVSLARARIHAAIFNHHHHHTTTNITNKKMTAAARSFSDAELAGHLDSLLVSSGGKWTVDETGTTIGRTFRFKTFAVAWVSANGP